MTLAVGKYRKHILLFIHVYETRSPLPGAAPFLYNCFVFVKREMYKKTEGATLCNCGTVADKFKLISLTFIFSRIEPSAELFPPSDTFHISLFLPFPLQTLQCYYSKGQGGAAPINFS